MSWNKNQNKLIYDCIRKGVFPIDKNTADIFVSKMF